ncbi:hypothetical protein PP428_gp257 [Escherichia phage vB_EcoM_RZ]|uniref:Uncharacterized protein n=1 Tax=Escherichia phage vB_EcoM_RZ TaxID=2893954 RepID=A0AAE8YIP5_9CAUD|nr:hypothetical protein PP428_gp257 [Escherichia phage vB_EcoM_RZ]QMV33852.1 hypothetical protein [Escherichia phage DK-13]QUL77515.1 hypothetical protein [Escherichia phage UPEC07]UGL60073.1 hypothetical protein [Escherichia phage vB_EcoM_RZ]
MGYYCDTWAIVNITNQKKIVVIDGRFYTFSNESDAWEECLRLKKLNPEVELTVKQTRIQLPWKTYE